jgi:hypothetical protein
VFKQGLSVSDSPRPDGPQWRRPGQHKRTSTLQPYHDSSPVKKKVVSNSCGQKWQCISPESPVDQPDSLRVVLENIFIYENVTHTYQSLHASHNHPTAMALTRHGTSTHKLQVSTPRRQQLTFLVTTLTVYSNTFAL